MDRQADRQRDRKTDKQTKRQTNRQTDRLIDLIDCYRIMQNCVELCECRCYMCVCVYKFIGAISPRPSMALSSASGCIQKRQMGHFQLGHGPQGVGQVLICEVWQGRDLI